MLKIKNLTASIKDQTILNDVNLNVDAGEIHAIMGMPKCGKSSLVHTILGNPILDLKKGSILYKRKSILKKSIEERSQIGIFTTFQFLPILDGITNFDLVKEILAAHNDKRNSNTVETEYKKLLKDLELSSNHGSKFVNDETMTMLECKKNEILHVGLLNPDLIILDEIDRDIEEEDLKSLAYSIKKLLNKKNAAIVVSNNPKFLVMIKPTHVSLMDNGTLSLQKDYKGF